MAIRAIRRIHLGCPRARRLDVKIPTNHPIGWGATRLEPSAPIACARSSTRSSAASIPHESRTRSAGTAARGALDGLVRHRLRDLDQRLDAAERLGQREQLRSPRRSGPRPDAGTRPSPRCRASGRRRRPSTPCEPVDDRRARSRCAPPSAGAACAARGARGSSRAARARRRSSSARSAPPRDAPGRARSRRRRRRPSARRGTWSSSARRRPRRAPAAAGRPASRTCCRPRRTRRRATRDDAGDVDHLQRRVGRRLDPDQLACRAHRGGDRVEVGLVDHRVLEPPAREHLVDEPVGAAVEVVGDDDVVAGVADRGDQRVRRAPCRDENALRRARPRARRARAPARRASGWPSASSR